MKSPSRVETPIFVSDALRSNPLGDPHERLLPVYLPPGYDNDPQRRYPTLYLLSAHGNSGPGLLNWHPWDVNVPQQLDALLARRAMPPVIVVLPDMWTRFGSSQFINSAGMGRYEDYLTREIIPYVDAHYRTLPERAHRGVLGRSSGGYGALVQGMRHPELFGALACQSGDMYWEYTCIPGISKMHQQLEHFGGLDTFIRNIPEIRPKGGTFWELIMTVCWAAAFGSNPHAPHGFDLPIDPEIGALNEAVWARWLTYDPVRMLDVPDYAEALRGMRLVFVDVGQYDEYQLQVGARVLHRKMDALSISHEYEEFPDGHRGTHYRYETSLPKLAEALQ